MSLVARAAGWLGVLLGVGLLSGCASSSGWTIQPIGRINDPDLKESSGLVASRRHPDVFWTHNDDGLPEIFAITRTGRILARYRLDPARNIDWEEVAIDDANNLYILDNTSRVFENEATTVYVVPEPDLYQSNHTLQPSRVLEVPVGNQGLDFEAMFWWQDALYFINKPWDAKFPHLFRFSTDFGENRSQDLGPVPIQALITGADIDPVGERIALVSYRAVFVYRVNGDPREILRQDPLISPLNARQVEAIAWRGDELLLSNEQRDIFRLKRNQWESSQAPFFRSQRQWIPRLDGAPNLAWRFEDWNKGHWLRSAGVRPTVMGRVAWSREGLHIGIRLPDQLVLEELGDDSAEGFLDWFKPGRVYLMVNPSGNRSLTYEPNDRCVVIGRTAAGRLLAEARTLRPGTLVANREASPDWIEVSGLQNRLLITISNQMPGLGDLVGNRQIGFNLLIMAEDGLLLSWTPLTLRFSWDNPSVWGLLETKG